MGGKWTFSVAGWLNKGLTAARRPTEEIAGGLEGVWRGSAGPYRRDRSPGIGRTRARPAWRCWGPTGALRRDFRTCEAPPTVGSDSYTRTPAHPHTRTPVHPYSRTPRHLYAQTRTLI
eukprot:129062-Prorocentrum_minimum.AAC.1